MCLMINTLFIATDVKILSLKTIWKRLIEYQWIYQQDIIHEILIQNLILFWQYPASGDKINDFINFLYMWINTIIKQSFIPYKSWNFPAIYSVYHHIIINTDYIMWVPQTTHLAWVGQHWTPARGQSRVSVPQCSHCFWWQCFYHNTGWSDGSLLWKSTN